jgi:enamine deaminase RidA (YjgF/YER057c/UK114 family)
MQRRRVESRTGWGNRVGYSRATRVGDGGVGDRVLVAGTTATDEEGTPLVDADPAEQQTRVALTRFGTLSTRQETVSRTWSERGCS